MGYHGAAWIAKRIAAAAPLLTNVRAANDMVYQRVFCAGAKPAPRPVIAGRSRSDPARSAQCQTACKPGSVRPGKGGTAIPLGRDLRRASCDQPGRRVGNIPGGGAACRPYSVLLPVGFAVPPALPPARCALAAPFHPCPQRPEAVRAVCFLWHFPWGRPRRRLAGTVFPWSPDFPPAAGFSARTGGRPAVWPTRDARGSEPRQPPLHRSPSSSSSVARQLSGMERGQSVRDRNPGFGIQEPNRAR